MITYRLYEKGNGMIQNRVDHTVDENGLLFKFDGCDDGYVTFQKGDQSLTRRLTNGKCRLEKIFFDGDIQVMAAKDNMIWQCEPLSCYAIGDRILVRPNVIDYEKRTIELEALVDDLQKDIITLKAKVSELIKDSKAGYNLI